MRPLSAGQAVSTPIPQAVVPQGATVTPPTATPSAPPSSVIQWTPDGKLAGIDGVLDQIFTSLSKQVVPVLQNDVLPILQRDKELQKTVGMAVGRGVVRALTPYLIVVTGSIAFMAWVYWRSKQPSTRANPRRRRHASYRWTKRD